MKEVTLARLWVPLLVVGAALYWTLALGLGGLSLAWLGLPSAGPVVEDSASYSITVEPDEEPITVRLADERDVLSARNEAVSSQDHVSKPSY